MTVVLVILLSLAPVVIAQHFYQTGAHTQAATALLILSLLAMAWATRRPDTPPEPCASPPPPRPPISSRTIGVAMLMVGLIACAAASYKLTMNWEGHLMSWAPIFLCGLIASSIGTDVAQGYLRRRIAGADSRHGQIQKVGEVIIFIIILAAAIWLRAYRLDWYPPPDGMTSTEEPQFGGSSYMILKGSYRPWLWMQTLYPGALTFHFLGPSLLHARIHGVIYGVLTLIPFYLLLRRLAGIKAALFAMALFATCVWHFTSSRYNDQVYHGVFFVTVSIALLIHSYRSPRLSLALWLGFFSALEFYDYDAFKATPVAVIIFFLCSYVSKIIALLCSKMPERFNAIVCLVKQEWKKQGLIILMMVLVSAPFVHKVAQSPHWYFDSISRAVGGTDGASYYDMSDMRNFLEKRWERLTRIAKALNYRANYGDYCAVVIPTDPLLDFTARVIFPISLTYALLHPLRRHNWFFLMMFFMVVGGNVFTKNFDLRRFAGIVLYTYVLIGLFIGKVFLCLDSAYPSKRVSRMVFTVLMGCALATGIVNYRYAFHHVYVYYDTHFFRNQYTILTKLVNRCVRREDAPILITQYPLNFLQPNDFYWLIDMRSDGVASGDAVSIPELLRKAPPFRDTVLIFQRPYDFDLLRGWLRSLCPSLLFHPFGDRNDHPAYHALFCRITPRQRKEILDRVNNGTGLMAEYNSLDETAVLHTMRVEPFISLESVPDVWRKYIIDSGGRGYRATWIGTIGIPQSGSYAFSLHPPDGGGMLYIDSKAIPWSSDVKLERGNHAIRIEAEYKPPREMGIKLLWKTPESGSWNPVPLWKVARPAK
ncbi:MAG: glycosyltransferase family 39 protein [Syntrophales bacterium]|nr:glycosyltransferase family 39 protein [Syntrophales bacterium]